MILSCALLAVAANAQDLRFGVEAGYNATFEKSKVKFMGSKTSDSECMSGFNLGPVMKYNFDDNMGLKAGLLYHYAGKDKTRMHDIQIPVDFVYTLNCGLYFMVGPKFNIGAALYQKVDGGDNVNYYDKDEMGAAYNRFDIMLNLGVGYEFLDNFYAQAAFDCGFLNQLDGDYVDFLKSEGFDKFKLKKNALTISVGYYF